MTKEQVIELAKQAGASRYTNRHYPDRPTHTFTVEQLELYTALVRNAALTEALNSYSPDDTAADFLAKLEDLKEPT